ARPTLIYDYYGFPPHTYEIQYPAPGAPELAATLAETLAQAGLQASVDPERGHDHGVFIPLKLMFPKADVPVVQLSLDNDLEPVDYLDDERALYALREYSVLIDGKGISFQNICGYGFFLYTLVLETFNAWFYAAIEEDHTERVALLENWESAPHAR